LPVQAFDFVDLVFGEIVGALAVHSSGSVFRDDLASRREEIEFTFNLVA
jgi:hypothetical protein